jgi:hypothetical protein
MKKTTKITLEIASLFILIFQFSIFAQVTDSTKLQVRDTTKLNVPSIVPTRTITANEAPAVSDSGITDMGIAVSPSNLRFRTKPGTTETKYITITNDTRKFEKFKISVSDYDMNDKGAVTQLPVGTPFEYGLSKKVSITPSFVELKPGEAKKVGITLNIPDEPNSYKAGWCLIMVDQTTEKKYITPPNNGKDNVVLGIIPVFGFGVYIFQNPPNVKLNKVEITKFNFNYDKTDKYVSVNAKNVGTGLGFCKLYIEVNNLNTGYKEKLFVKQFTIFPGKERILDFKLPGSLAKGNYVGTAVLDFGSTEEIEAAEVEFKVE